MSYWEVGLAFSVCGNIAQNVKIRLGWDAMREEEIGGEPSFDTQSIVTNPTSVVHGIGYLQNNPTLKFSSASLGGKGIWIDAAAMREEKQAPASNTEVKYARSLNTTAT